MCGITPARVGAMAELLERNDWVMRRRAEPRRIVAPKLRHRRAVPYHGGPESHTICLASGSDRGT
jgi:hypothetical protein